MEKQINEELARIVKMEKFQSKLTNYINSIGKILLFLLPVILVIITFLTFFIFPELPEVTRFGEQTLGYQILTITFIIVLGIYFINSVILFLGASKTKSSLNARLNFERKRGRPIDSLDGFDLLYNNVDKVINLLKIIAFVSIISLALFITMLLIADLTLGFAAMGLALIGLGLAIIIRSLKLNIHDVNGLQDFYNPSTHQIFLDNLFAEVISNHLDPVTYLHWDEFLAELTKILNPSFVQKIKEQEEDELPITFAVEKMLFLYYLNFQGVLTKDQLVQEFKEIIDISADNFNIENGLYMEGSWYFSAKDFSKLFNFVKEHNPGFFNIIDRLQLELSDNIKRLSNDPIYLDSSTQEVVYLNSELNIMLYLYNNSMDAKKYRLKVVAPGFKPNKVVMNIEVEGRGKFEIPKEKIPFVAQDRLDITQVLSNMLENGDTAWITLEPRELGTQTIQIFLETLDGVIIEGKTKTVTVSKNLKDYIKKLSSVGSIIGGLAVPLSRILPSLLTG
ncbi:MAG: membrane protein of unknown function [Promethearchaeota archaeon]|nr:MAG: membrane protein of unknown function [Candidatus Lokiarchaeota archaeon]